MSGQGQRTPPSHSNTDPSGVAMAGHLLPARCAPMSGWPFGCLLGGHLDCHWNCLLFPWAFWALETVMVSCGGAFLWAVFLQETCKGCNSCKVYARCCPAPNSPRRSLVVQETGMEALSALLPCRWQSVSSHAMGRDVPEPATDGCWFKQNHAC